MGSLWRQESVLLPLSIAKRLTLNLPLICHLGCPQHFTLFLYSLQAIIIQHSFSDLLTNLLAIERRIQWGALYVIAVESFVYRYNR